MNLGPAPSSGRCSDLNLTTPAQVLDLLRQPEGVIASVIADGTYDGAPVYHAAPPGNPVGRRT